MERLKADSFTAFLEAQESQKVSAQKTSLAAPASGGTALTLLFRLAQAPKKQMPVAELMASSGLAFTDFAEALKSLGDLGYLTLAGPPGNELASLTKLGDDVSRLADKEEEREEEEEEE